MAVDVHDAIARLERIHLEFGYSIKSISSVTLEQLDNAEKAVGYEFTQDLRDLWLYSNGSGGGVWFYLRHDLPFDAIGQAYNFFSLEKAIGGRCSGNVKWFELWEGTAPGDPPGFRAPEIVPEYMDHCRWLPIGGVPGGSHQLRYDATPTPAGQYGQIIAYQHDPEDIKYLAPSISGLIWITCDTLEDLRDTDVDEFRSLLEYYDMYRDESSFLG